MSNTSLLLLALLLQVGLTFVLLFRLGPGRVAAIRRGEVKVKDVALGQKVWPEKLTLISNAYASQFELPVMFYALVGLAIALQRTDLVLAGGSWVFVLSRVIHAWIHVTSNYVPSRFRAFVVGVFTLLAMWVWLAGRLLLEGV